MICHNVNKSNSHNNEFYICVTCNKNICPLYKSSHDKSHKTINYDNKNYICRRHNKAFNKYFKTCNENICIICEKKHNNHDIFDFSKIILDKEELLKIVADLKFKIDKYKCKI